MLNKRMNLGYAICVRRTIVLPSLNAQFVKDVKRNPVYMVVAVLATGDVVVGEILLKCHGNCKIVG